MEGKYLIFDASPTAGSYEALCLDNDWTGLERLHKQLRDRSRLVANSLRSDGFTILNCSAGNVTAHALSCSRSDAHLHEDIASLCNQQIAYQLGIGSSLRAAYLALRRYDALGKERD